MRPEFCVHSSHMQGQNTDSLFSCAGQESVPTRDFTSQGQLLYVVIR